MNGSVYEVWDDCGCTVLVFVVEGNEVHLEKILHDVSAFPVEVMKWEKLEAPSRQQIWEAKYNTSEFYEVD